MHHAWYWDHAWLKPPFEYNPGTPSLENASLWARRGTVCALPVATCEVYVARCAASEKGEMDEALPGRTAERAGATRPVRLGSRNLGLNMVVWTTVAVVRVVLVVVTTTTTGNPTSRRRSCQ